MFCPLCQSEFREGFTTCRECGVDLVVLREEAAASAVKVWSGERQSLLDTILAALDAAGIRAHFEETTNLSHGRNVAGMALTSSKPMFRYEVWVLRADSDRALAAVGEIEKLT